MKKSYARPMDLPRAWRALKLLAADPDETSHVFTIIDALSYRAPDHLVGLFHATAEGRRLLAENRNIVKVLADRDALRAMPAGSLAHAYLAFVESEGITADGLVSASESGRLMDRDDPDLTFVSDRMRDTHDLWHAATGYKGDVLGEAALLAFNVPQTRNPGIAAITLLGLYRVQTFGAALTILDGLARGARAEYLPAIDWEALLPLPLDEVRARLRLGAPPVYEPVRTSDLRAQGRLAPRPMVAPLAA
jgi:ubiquinone biosynthesis protein COQ4